MMDAPSNLWFNGRENVGRMQRKLVGSFLATVLLASLLAALEPSDDAAETSVDPSGSSGDNRSVAQGAPDLRPDACDHPGNGQGSHQSCSGEPDPYRHLQWALDKIQAEEAWSHATGRGIVIAILDSGVERNHPDLRDRLIWIQEADIVDPQGPDGPEDAAGHGTIVAGIAAAATHNGIGIAGVAPGAMILPVRVFPVEANQSEFPPLGLGSDVSTYQHLLDPWQWAEGITFAVENGAHVLSISSDLGLPFRLAGRHEAMIAAIDHAWKNGAVIVSSAGNNAQPYCAEPASHPRVLCVGATARDDLLAEYSNHDHLHPNYLVAPGGATKDDPAVSGQDACWGYVVSTERTWNSSLFCDAVEVGYDAFGGTSMAAPQVAAVAALLFELGLTNEEIVDRILCTADDLGEPGRDPLYGYGRVNALRAVTNDRNPDC